MTLQGVLNLIPVIAAPTRNTGARALIPLVPSLALCMLFVSSTRFTESISLSKYPVGYAAYRRRVSMFVPVLTPVWGALLKLQGKEEEAKVESLVWGQEVGKDE